MFKGKIKKGMVHRMISAMIRRNSIGSILESSLYSYKQGNSCIGKRSPILETKIKAKKRLYIRLRNDKKNT